MEFRDQQGCVFRLPVKGEVETQYLSAQSNGVGCSSGGFAEGKGKLFLVRSDGKKQKEFSGIFHEGLLFNRAVEDLPFIGFDSNQAALYLLDSDAQNKLYSLWQIPYHSYLGVWSAQSPSVLIVTENQELFRQLNSIQAVIDRITQRVEQLGIKGGSFDLLAVRDLKKATDKSLMYSSSDNQKDYWLYKTTLGYNSRGQFWQFDPNNSTNYLFRWEERQARKQAEIDAERKRETQRRLEQDGYEAQRQLADYRALRIQAKEQPKALLARQVRDVSYQPTGHGGYYSMMQGHAQEVSLIAHLDKQSGGLWRIDYPYEAELSVPAEATVAEGWYLLRGKESLSSEKQDKQGLPLTHIEGSTLMACESKGCSDLRDPVKLMRLKLNDPEWSPENAQETVNKAWPGRQQGDE
ncbi:hypothetical protein FOB45_26430 [Pseudomonas luteola]|nr:hypothetical protein FOB45_26430 [Pseudomonas luteola]